MEEKRYKLYMYDDYKVDLYNNGVLDKSITNDFELEKLLNHQDKENHQLKKQLAEKEKEIAEYSDINNILNSCLQEKCILCEEEHNQDKISFAVEQLEFAQKYIKQYVNNFDDMYECLYAIDKQIKSLKGDNYESNK